MIFRQLFDQVSSTYSYLLGDEQTHEAVFIDTVFEQHARDAALVRELGLKLLFVLDTHCHADHVTGAWLMKNAFGSLVGLAGSYQAENVDLSLTGGEFIKFGEHSLEIMATPGHTSGCMSFITEDRSMVFTGDALLVRGAGRTDFQGGDASRLFQSIRQKLFALPAGCVVYPGHDYDGRTSSTIGEERMHNPRIGGRAREEDFVGYMRNLGLPHPKQLAIALPANMRAGKPEVDVAATASPWGPVVTTYAGLPEIAPEWVAQHREDVHILDVRTLQEYNGDLGHIKGAQLIPLDDLRARIAEVATEKPVVVVCQTGSRAAMATMILLKAGVSKRAKLTGGMVRWHDLSLPSSASAFAYESSAL